MFFYSTTLLCNSHREISDSRPVQKFWWGADRAPIGKNVAPIG